MDIGATQAGVPTVPVKTTANPRCCERLDCLSRANLPMLSSVFSELELTRKRAYLSVSVLQFSVEKH